jgi:hypothetical protein
MLMEPLSRAVMVGSVCVLIALGCNHGNGNAPNATPNPESYRLLHSGESWDRAGSDDVLGDIRPRYSEFFDTIYNRKRHHNPNLLPLRDDLERSPVTRANFDALNAVAICYFELNYLAESDRGGPNYLAHSHRAAKLLAVPWRAYSEISDARLRNAILDFFEDIARGKKRLAARTAPRVKTTVATLARRETDPERLARIRAMVALLTAAEEASTR